MINLFRVTWYDVANATAVLLDYVIKTVQLAEKALQKTARELRNYLAKLLPN